MVTSTPKKTFKELFRIILSADKEKSRQAMRDIKKLLYSSSGEKVKYKQIKEIVNEAPKTYETITEDWRQENFVIAVSVIYFLHDKENQLDYFFPWLFQLLQNNNGYIRYAAVRMIENELGPLTVHIRCPGRVSIVAISPIQADDILLFLYRSLIHLMDKFRRSEYNKYKYVSSLPTGVYKSIQQLLSSMEEYCGEDYLNHLKRKFYSIKQYIA